MPYFTPRRFRLLCLIVFSLGLLASSFVLAPKYRTTTWFAHGFIITSVHSLSIPGDPRTPLRQQKIVRYQKADGDWKELKTTYNSDGSVQGISTEFGQGG